jgi:hypothetical protein
MDLPPAEHLLADAAQYLIRKAQGEAARALLSCSLSLYEVEVEIDSADEWRWHCAVNVSLQGPADVCHLLDELESPPNPTRTAVRRALQGQLPLGCMLHLMRAHAGVNVFDPTWRGQLLEQARGENVDNQGVGDFSTAVVTWNGLRFRSESERRVAAALDTAGALYLPNCRARLGLPPKRQNREADFLVCHEGKWGILEVDGEPYHPPARKVHEDERDRLFKLHGIRVVEHFDAHRCFESPQAVVREFLALLKQA